MVEVAVLTPLLMLVVLVAAQFALVTYARHVAFAAAREGLRAATAYDGSADAGEARGDRYARLLSRDVLLDPHTRATRGAETATVEVRGRTIRILPLLPLRPVVAVVERPVERFVGGS